MTSGDNAPLMTAEAVVAELRSLAEDSDGWLKLAEGIPDERMDSWPVAVPDDIRTLLRAVGGFEAGYLHVNFDHPANHRSPDASFAWQAGERDGYWVLNPDTGTDWKYFVDIDPATGRWGDVFAIVEHKEYERVRPDLFTWLRGLIEAARRALATDEADLDDGDWEEIDDAFGEIFFEGVKKAKVEPIGVPAARRSPDPVTAAIAAALPDEAFLADLRPVPHPATACFDDVLSTGPLPVFHRFHGGGLVAALPTDDG